MSQLVDCRHAPTDLDRQMIEWLLAERLPFCLVPTKMDKLKRGARRAAMVRIVDALELPADQVSSLGLVWIRFRGNP